MCCEACVCCPECMFLNSFTSLIHLLWHPGGSLMLSLWLHCCGSVVGNLCSKVQGDSAEGLA